MLVLAQAGAQASPWASMVVIGIVFAIMYFLMLRPQQKQQQQHKELLVTLKKGDDVITQSGIFGKIYLIGDKVVTLEIANNVRVRVLKSAVQGRAGAEEPEAKLAVTATQDEAK